ncbi:MAG: hypothetical protein WC988_01620 [Patescibacteria group bacterium]
MTNASTLGKSAVETREVDRYTRIEREIDHLFKERKQEVLASLKSSYAELIKDGQATEQEGNELCWTKNIASSRLNSADVFRQ